MKLMVLLAFRLLFVSSSFQQRQRLEDHMVQKGHGQSCLDYLEMVQILACMCIKTVNDKNLEMCQLTKSKHFDTFNLKSSHYITANTRVD